MKNFFLKFKKWILAHKFWSAVIIVVVIFTGWKLVQAARSTDGNVRYVTAAVKKGAVISSINASGQVSSTNQVDIKAKVSGDVTYVAAQAGQKVAAGALLFQLDAKEAQKSVRDAEISLESAKLSLEKLMKPADSLSILEAENSLTKAKADLVKAYDDGFNTVANAFLDLPGAMTGLYDILYSSDASSSSVQWNISYYADSARDQYNDDGKSTVYKEDADKKYQAAKAAYDKNFSDYKNATRYDDAVAIEVLITKTYDTTKVMAEAVKSTTNLIQYYQDRLTSRGMDIVPKSYTHLASLGSYTGDTNSHLLSLLNIKNSIRDANFSIPQKTQSLEKLREGSDSLDIRSSELSLKQRENALADAKEKLSDYFIRAPFAGTLAAMNFKKSDSVSSGIAVATLITANKFAEISLNEVDVAKIQIGQKATLTFDAIPDLSIAGAVAEIDSLGTSSQGVVTYNVKISFDTQDERIKPAMSVSAEIITDMKEDVLIVPNSAVKSQNGQSYMEMFSEPLPEAERGAGVISKITPRRVPVEVGISNDSLTEIISGVKEGDEIVVRTILPTGAKAAATAAPSLFGSPSTSTRPAGGGNFRSGN